MQWTKLMLVVALMLCVFGGVIGCQNKEETPTLEMPKSVSEELTDVQYSSAPSNIPENTVCTEPPIIEEDSNPYSSMEVSVEDKELLARMVYAESRGECFDGQVAVVQVALNRTLHDRFPDNIRDVLLAPNQFAVGEKYNEEQMEAVEAALDGYNALDLNTDVVFFSTGSLKYGSYYKTIGGHVFRTYS